MKKVFLLTALLTIPLLIAATYYHPLGPQPLTKTTDCPGGKPRCAVDPNDTDLQSRSPNALWLRDQVHLGEIDLNLNLIDWPELASARIKEVVSWLRYKKDASQVPFNFWDGQVFGGDHPDDTEEVIRWILDNYAQNDLAEILYDHTDTIQWKDHDPSTGEEAINALLDRVHAAEAAAVALTARVYALENPE